MTVKQTPTRARIFCDELNSDSRKSSPQKECAKKMWSQRSMKNHPYCPNFSYVYICKAAELIRLKKIDMKKEGHTTISSHSSHRGEKAK